MGEAALGAWPLKVTTPPVEALRNVGATVFARWSRTMQAPPEARSVAHSVFASVWLFSETRTTNVEPTRRTSGNRFPRTAAYLRRSRSYAASTPPTDQLASSWTPHGPHPKTDA